MKESEIKGLIIRPMGLPDVHEASIIEQASFSMPWSEKDFSEMIMKPYAHYYVAVLEDIIVGICGILDMAGEGDISNVAVKEEVRNQGVGYLMVKSAISDCESKGIKDFTLEVRVSNKGAIKLYEKLGFVYEGIRPGFYENPTEDAGIYWKRN